MKLWSGDSSGVGGGEYIFECSFYKNGQEHETDDRSISAQQTEKVGSKRVGEGVVEYS